MPNGPGGFGDPVLPVVERDFHFVERPVQVGRIRRPHFVDFDPFWELCPRVRVISHRGETVEQTEDDTAELAGRRVFQQEVFVLVPQVDEPFSSLDDSPGRSVTPHAYKARLKHGAIVSLTPVLASIAPLLEASRQDPHPTYSQTISARPASPDWGLPEHTGSPRLRQSWECHPKRPRIRDSGHRRRR